MRSTKKVSRDYLKKVGLNIKIARIKAGLKQVDVEEKIGIDARHYQDIEYGRVNLTLDTLHKLAKLYKVREEELVKRD